MKADAHFTATTRGIEVNIGTEGMRNLLKVLFQSRADPGGPGAMAPVISKMHKNAPKIQKKILGRGHSPFLAIPLPGSGGHPLPNPTHLVPRSPTLDPPLVPVQHDAPARRAFLHIYLIL